jgi:hypothetical protein
MSLHYRISERIRKVDGYVKIVKQNIQQLLTESKALIEEITKKLEKEEDQDIISELVANRQALISSVSMLEKQISEVK